jgi:lipopolysaccharide/colanic/teichoic acid biosynthesis glycosyltransferase
MASEVSSSSYDAVLSLAEQLDRRRIYFALKRTLDVVVAATALLVLSPIMLIIAVLVKLDSPGPAIFTQKRVGLRRKEKEGDGNTRPPAEARWELGTFDFYKFRTMKRDASPDLHRAYVEAFIRNDREAMAAVQGTDTDVRKILKDPRVTRLGAFLRRTSLDELPQFWSVLKGDMTLVGPRPALPYEVEAYLPWHHKRLAALPGITGPWQVSARSSVDFDDMVKMDLDYIENQSLWLDLKILVQTPLAVLRSRGAV